tara:strand:- start:225 stop:704 length:480 start_codon:yes stop_codon:yes gene_type:complete
MISIKLFTIFMQMVNFLILLFLMSKFIITPLMEFLEKRASSIKSDIENAQLQRSESEELLSKRKKMLNDARQEAKQIKDQASDTVTKEREIVLADANKEADQIIQHAKKDVQLMVSKAKKDLTSKIGELSVQLSEKIIRKNIDKSTQKDIVAESVEKLS